MSRLCNTCGEFKDRDEENCRECSLRAELERVREELEKANKVLLKDRESLLKIPAMEVRLAEAEKELAHRKSAADTFFNRTLELESGLSAANRAIREMMNELGVPQPGYPAPIANAYRIGEKALAPEPAGPIDAHAKYTWQPGD